MKPIVRAGVSGGGVMGQSLGRRLQRLRIRQVRAGRLSVLVTLALAAAGLAAAGGSVPGLAAGVAWSVVPTPNRPGPSNGSLTGVSCVSVSACFAVGSQSGATGPGPHTLTESWNGSAWSILKSPNQGIISSLTSVSCTSASTCMAVGSYYTLSGHYRALIESWNGTSWSVSGSPNPGNGYAAALSGVSCTSATSCTAVGWYSVNGGGPFTLIESWNGSTWSIVPSPNPAGEAPAPNLKAVSCTSTSACVAVGSYETSSGLVRTLIESWNGGTWSIVPSPNPSLDGSYLAAVSCRSASLCTAVGQLGQYGNGTLIESWNGSTWSVVPSPNPTGGRGALAGVSCPSASSCRAIGSYPGSRGYSRALAESWNGSKWSIVPTPNQGTLNNVLGGVSCRSASACVAVGDFAITTRVTQTLAETWHAGKWSIARSANHVTYDNGLGAVSCPSAGFCVALGGFVDTKRVLRPLIEKWNGSDWSIMPSPDVSGVGGINCRSAKFCFAVGGRSGKTLIEKWNGSTWSIVPSPSPRFSDYLAGVSCPSASSCTAVGSYVNSAQVGDSTLVESWNGKTWSVVPSPTGPNQTDLTGVSCLSATSCTAVGDFYTDRIVSQTLIESWNGSTWSIPDSPDQGAGNNTLAGVSCRSASFCIRGRGLCQRQRRVADADRVVERQHLVNHAQPGPGNREQHPGRRLVPVSELLHRRRELCQRRRRVADADRVVERQHLVDLAQSQPRHQGESAVCCLLRHDHLLRGRRRRRHQRRQPI